MIAPSQITIDTTQWPAAMNAAIAAIDAAIQNWTPRESTKTVSLNLASVAGPLAAKQQGLDKIISAYRKFGWLVDYDTAATTETVRVLVFRLPD